MVLWGCQIPEGQKTCIPSKKTHQRYQETFFANFIHLDKLSFFMANYPVRKRPNYIFGNKKKGKL